MTTITTNKFLFYLFNTLLLLAQLHSFFIPIVGDYILYFLSPDFNPNYLNILISWPIYISAVTFLIILNFKDYLKRKYSVGLFVLISIQVIIWLDAIGWCRFGVFFAPSQSHVQACIRAAFIDIASISIPALFVLILSILPQSTTTRSTPSKLKN